MKMPLWQQFLVIAVAPGICEELMFRGFFPRFFEGKSKTMTVVITALLFAAFHLDPFRFVPVFFLGLLLGYLTIRSGSIYNSMLSHSINNGLALVLVSFADKPWMKYLSSGGDALQIWLAIPALIIFSAALYLFHRVSKTEENN
jgi:membrane protease YdiL (CAAX protease family)